MPNEWQRAGPKSELTGSDDNWLQPSRERRGPEGGWVIGQTKGKHEGILNKVGPAQGGNQFGCSAGGGPTGRGSSDYRIL